MAHTVHNQGPGSSSATGILLCSTSLNIFSNPLHSHPDTAHLSLNFWPCLTTTRLRGPPYMHENVSCECQILSDWVLLMRIRFNGCGMWLSPCHVICSIDRHSLNRALVVEGGSGGHWPGSLSQLHSESPQLYGCPSLQPWTLELNHVGVCDAGTYVHSGTVIMMLSAHFVGSK